MGFPLDQGQHIPKSGPALASCETARLLFFPGARLRLTVAPAADLAGAATRRPTATPPSREGSRLRHHLAADTNVFVPGQYLGGKLSRPGDVYRKSGWSFEEDTCMVRVRLTLIGYAEAKGNDVRALQLDGH
ncbi:unnamed protein product [Urochloa humidicola]